MKIEGLTWEHVGWFVFWSLVLAGTLTSDRPYTLNITPAIQVAKIAHQGILALYELPGKTAPKIDEYTKRWNQTDESSKPKTCYRYADGTEECW